MDLNHQLIEAVRQCPLLYKNGASLADRKCGWEQIAQEMKMQEAILKTRWHFLREHYKRNVLSGSQIVTNQFPYKKEMEFLLPYLRPQKREETRHNEMISIIKPEFVITPADLENDSGNEEYVFLEVETLGPEYEPNNEVIQQTNEADLRKELEHEQQLEQQPPGNEANELDDEVQIEMHKGESEKEEEQKDKDEQQNDKKPDIIEIQQATCNKNGIIEEEAVRTQIQEASSEKVEAKIELCEVNSSNERVGNASNSNETNSKQSTLGGERCEDAIFGELVSAMLKQMPADKKRSVKREIMNLLLT